MKTIYVALLDENVDVWRPVQAQECGPNRFRVVEQFYDRNIERWQFEPGDEVICEVRVLSEEPALVAVRKA